jgi:hypothetical protein
MFKLFSLKLKGLRAYLPNQTVASYMYQLLKAVEFMHKYVEIKKSIFFFCY